MLMTDDTGWNDFGCYSGGGAGLGHPTPNVDRIAKEGAVFTNWYGQASCTAGRASFLTGRIPIHSALSIVVAPGDENALRKETPTIAEFFKKNGYSTYFSGKWHLGDKPEAYPIAHGFADSSVSRQNQSRRNRSEQSPHVLGSGGTRSALCIAVSPGIYGFGVSLPGPATEQSSRIGQPSISSFSGWRILCICAGNSSAGTGESASGQEHWNRLEHLRRRLRSSLTREPNAGDREFQRGKFR